MYLFCSIYQRYAQVRTSSKAQDYSGRKGSSFCSWRPPKFLKNSVRTSQKTALRLIATELFHKPLKWTRNNCQSFSHMTHPSNYVMSLPDPWLQVFHSFGHFFILLNLIECTIIFCHVNYANTDQYQNNELKLACQEGAISPARGIASSPRGC
jgi:hypothetical protein